VGRAGHLAYPLGPGPVGHEAVQGDRDVEVLVVGGELVVEGVRPDGGLAAVRRNRIGVKGLAEGASRELARQFERGLAGLRRERADAKEKFVRDFVAAWDKVMNLDRFDLA
jgi:hypothetical protein